MEIDNMLTKNKISNLAKDEEGNYKIEKVEISRLTEDMEIWNKADMESFRDKE